MIPEPPENLIERFCQGDPVAAEQLFLAFEPYLRMMVRRRLSNQLRAKFDSGDVVQSVWLHLLDRQRAAGLRLNGPEHFQAFLQLEVRHRLIDHFRHHHQALEREQSMAATHEAGALSSRQPRPSEIAQANQLWEKLLALCPPDHHELLRLKRQGLSVAEIASQTGLHGGSIRRIFRRLARQLAFDEPHDF
jgi:RNA polymerase sigma-70 factor (ECF subfamily)